MDITPRFWENLHVPDIINPFLTVDCFKIKIKDILTKKGCKNEALFFNGFEPNTNLD